MDKGVRSTSLYHCIQCGIILKHQVASAAENCQNSISAVRAKCGLYPVYRGSIHEAHVELFVIKPDLNARRVLRVCFLV